jgi:alkaline phosphatase D
LTVDEYRRRYALYRLDPALQAVHASFPWVVTLDDHEIDNNWADEVPQDPAAQPPQQFLARRAAAFQAFYEHLPLPRSSRPRGIDMQLFRRLDWGDLARFHVLDTRQYRSDQVTSVAASRDPARSMLGAEQEGWLFAGLDRSHTRWNILASQVFMAENDRTAGAIDSFDFDNWDGYSFSRARLMQFLHERRPANPFVISGDRHATWVCDLTVDFADPAAPVVASEIVGTSITSGGDQNPGLIEARFGPIRAESPHWKYFDNGRGYLRCEIDASALLADLRVVSTVRQPQATVTTRATFAVEAGRPGIHAPASRSNTLANAAKSSRS